MKKKVILIMVLIFTAVVLSSCGKERKWSTSVSTPSEVVLTETILHESVITEAWD